MAEGARTRGQASWVPPDLTPGWGFTPTDTALGLRDLGPGRVSVYWTSVTMVRILLDSW
jgi:hypothetical protein